MESSVEEAAPDKTRISTSDPANWKRNIQKKRRYSAKGPPSYPTCSHRRGFQCRLLTMKDIKEFHDSFYAVPDKGKQDAFILKYVRANVPRKVNRGRMRKPKCFTYEYTIPNQAGNYTSVCRDTFLKVLKITKHRVIGVFTRFKSGNAQVPVESRGGDHKEEKYGGRREAVKSFIKGLKGCESHYSRGKSARIYLSSELSIGKLLKTYNEEKVSEGQPDLQVKKSFFYRIFSTKFNIGFSTPTVDECSTCLQLDVKIEEAKGDTDRKKQLETEKIIHIKQANSFFQHLKTKDDDCFLISYDCQKNLVLPKLSDQSAYYSRQLYCYNLSVTKGVSSDSLNPDNVTIYTWTEGQCKKSSNEVASVVFNELNCLNLTDYKSVRLVADGCAGQNKNINVLTMCGKWLCDHAPTGITQMELVFPVTGHSFLPADRVFGMIEKRLKKMKTILNAAEYHAVFAEHGKVKVVGQDWKPLNWKLAAQESVKSAAQLHFKISQCKKIILRKTRKGNILFQGELAYNLETGTAKSITKKGKYFHNIQPSEIGLGITVKEDKLQDVNKLLQKHFGTAWRDLEKLKWYKEVLDSNAKTSDSDENCGECECLSDPEFSDQVEIVTMAINC